MAGTPATLPVGMETLQATVTRLAETVGRLTTDVAGLMATEGGDYAGDSGPAVRAQLVDPSIDADRRRLDEHAANIAKLEVAMSESTETHLAYQIGVDTMMEADSRLVVQQEEQAKQVKSLKVERDPSFKRSSASSEREEQNIMLTDIHGV